MKSANQIRASQMLSSFVSIMLQSSRSMQVTHAFLSPDKSEGFLIRRLLPFPNQLHLMSNSDHYFWFLSDQLWNIYGCIHFKVIQYSRHLHLITSRSKHLKRNTRKQLFLFSPKEAALNIFNGFLPSTRQLNDKHLCGLVPCLSLIKITDVCNPKS